MPQSCATILRNSILPLRRLGRRESPFLGIEPLSQKPSFSSRIRQMDRGDIIQGLGNPCENVDSYFHPLPRSLSPVQTCQSIEIEGKFASSTRKRQSHLANPGSFHSVCNCG